ncbi:glycosyltransferase family 2 protein [Marinomonas arenicola]|uniref:glycosyltransferase n=1 Tax=Marinomonas TaxID=28253 RepID=UPI00105610DB|nr:glycosyltransferase [Marinomonas sp. KMM3893]
MKLLSIVTIVRNDIVGFRNTHESLKNKPRWVEWIVIDGASIDGTVGFIDNHSSEIDFFLSEKDVGIADAFNKGVKNSSGKFVIFINAGDILRDDFFYSAELIITDLKNNECSIGVSKIKFGDEIVGKSIGAEKQKIRNYLPHQGMIIKKDFFDKYGLYDIKYKLGMDYEWSLRFIHDWENEMNFYGYILTEMEPNGVSITNFKETFKSYHRARIKNKTLPFCLSLCCTYLMIYKRSIGIFVRKFFNH